MENPRDAQSDASPDKAPSKSLDDPEGWLDHHGDYLFRYALSRVRNRDAAEELVQETLLAALKARRSFEGRSSTRTWLVGILKHKIIDRARMEIREAALQRTEGSSEGAQHKFRDDGHWISASGPRDWGASPADLFERQEFIAALEGCIKNLPQRLQTVFALRTFDDWSTDEICKELELSPSNLWVLMHRARGRLRDCLEVNWFRTTRESD